MNQAHQFAKVPELLKNITLSLPLRKSQIANWGVRLLGIDKPFKGTFKGLPIEVHPMEAASRSAYFLGFYERETTAWAVDYFRREHPKVIMDVGAHFGYFIYLALAELEQANIYAFEPDPHTRAWLKRNLDMVNTTNKVHLQSVAVSNQKGTVKFVPSNPDEHNNLWAGINLGNKSPLNEIEVPAIALDNFCAEQGLKEVDLLIMDIEGGEGYAVDGMMDGIKRKIYKNVLLEMHPHALSGEHAPERIIKKFTDAGYNAYHFQAPYKDNVRSDKIADFYDLSWKPSYLKQVEAHTVKLEGWEHMLFCRESQPF